jgi:hypothetical protein
MTVVVAPTQAPAGGFSSMGGKITFGLPTV